MTCPHPEPADTRPEGIVSAHDLSAAESPSEEIVAAIVEHVDEEAEDLRPLSRYVDPDALDALFACDPEESRAELALSFQYEGYRVIVDAAGLIQVYPRLDARGDASR